MDEKNDKDNSPVLTFEGKKYDVNNLSNYKLLQYLWTVYKNKQKQNVVDLNTTNLSEQKYS